MATRALYTVPGTRAAATIGDVARAIKEDRPFRNSTDSLRGDRQTPRPRYEYGQLPHRYYDDVARATYVIWSYATPIAWRHADGTWTVPSERYSVTTSGHQGIARGLIALVCEKLGV